WVSSGSGMGDQASTFHLTGAVPNAFSIFCNLLFLLGIGFEVNIASLWETKIPFLVTLSFLRIYSRSVELLSIK
ncbi:MAG TPA: hypothetical protein VG098_06015, partial [Nitrososphaera sp.]|nr:hypothetical protein [Nitrososphaera sp.]